MAYIYHQWVNNEDITPEKMNNIERGIVDLHKQTSPQNVEKTSNKATSVTDEQNKYPSASAVRDYFINKTTTSYATNMRITSSPTKTRYINGENIDLTGILAECVRRAGVYSLSQTGQPYSYEQNLGSVSIPSSGIVAVPKKAYIDGMAPDQNQTFEYKVSWYDDVTHTTISTDAIVTVTTYTVRRIAIQDSSNVKKEYVQNEAIDLTGLVVNGYDINNELLVNGIDTSDLIPAPSVAYIAGLGEYEEAQLTVQVNYEEPLYHNIYTVSYEITISPEGWTVCELSTLTGQMLANYLNYSHIKIKGKNVEFIESNAASSCTDTQRGHLDKVFFKNCTTIGSSAFKSCYYLSGASFPNCSYINSSAFAECSGLNSIYFPECISIYRGAFKSCYNLLEASFPKCEIIDPYAFCNCFSLVTINIPKISSIPDNGFAFCRDLSSVYFSKCVIIGTEAFQGCTNLKSINFPICSSVSYNAFSHCINLTSISLPMCEIINYGAFRECEELRTISLPKCNYISHAAFSDCSNLFSIYLMNSVVCSLASNAFTRTPIARSQTYAYIYVPSSLYSEYINDNAWYYFSNKIMSI